MFGDRFDIKLGNFNQEYFDSLPEADYIVAPTIDNENFYHTVYADGEPIGVAGIIPSQKLPDTGFVQIVLAPDWRGKGLIEQVYNELAEQHGLKTLYATINMKNKNSQRAHQKIGFQVLSEEKMIGLRKRGLLDDDELRFKKELD